MARWDALTDRMWRCLEPHLPENGKRGGQWRDHRQVIGGILWKLRIGAPWPGALWAMRARFGPWQTAYDRLGRSRGGLTSKVHLACDGRGRPLSIVVTAGQRHERAQLVAVVDGIRVPRPGRGRPRKRPGHLVADRGYSYPAAAGCCGDGASRTPSQSGVTSGGGGRRAPAAPSGRTPPATVAGRWSNAA